MLTCAIDDKQSQYVIVTDIPVAFLLADMEETTHMLLEAEIAELIININPIISRKFIRKAKKGNQ